MYLNFYLCQSQWPSFSLPLWVTLIPFQKGHLSHPDHPHGSHTHANEALESYNTFSSYWPFVQFFTLLASPPHSTIVKSIHLSFFQGHFLV